MELELDIFNKKGLVRSCELIGYNNRKECLFDYTESKLKKMIIEKINPNNINLRDQYIKALSKFNVEYNEDDSDNNLRKKLYEFSRDLLSKAIEKMSKKKKKKLTDRIESGFDPEILDHLKKYGKKGTITGGSVLLLQGGAIAITSSNLGICLLLTKGLSVLSGIIGVTFPFAAYTGAAVIGGKILAIASLLSSPWVWGPVVGLTVIQFFRKKYIRQFVNLAGVNYLIEIKKLIEPIPQSNENDKKKLVKEGNMRILVYIIIILVLILLGLIIFIF